MIYLDHAATWPMLPSVREAMLPWLGVPANPSSVHRAGQRAAVALEEARESIAALVEADPAGVVLTSGATEANHLFLRAAPGPVAHGRLEHPCVQAAAAASNQAVHVLPTGLDGRVVLDVPAEVAVLSVMWLNHETGVIQPIDEARMWASEAGRLLHVDASQAAGKVEVTASGIDGLVLSAHKMGGPVGVGALVLQDGTQFPALLSGGGQERGRRAGTVNVAGAVGFGAACAAAKRDRMERNRRWAALAARLEAGVQRLSGRMIGADATPAIRCMVFPELPGEFAVQALDLAGVCVSHGAACASGSLKASAVLTAMGDEDADKAIRVSFGPTSTEAHVDAFLAGVERLLAQTVNW